MDLPAGGPRPPPERSPRRLEAARRVLVEGLPPQTVPRGSGGVGARDVPAKTLGFRVSTFIPPPWEVPEGPACMVPVA